MKYIKAFNNSNDLEVYKKSKLTAPHIFLNKQNLRDLDYLEEYDQLEYISSTATGGQYIDLGCKLLENTDDIRIDIKFNFKGHGKTGTDQSTFIASQLETSPYPGFVLRVAKTSIDNYNTHIPVEFKAKWNITNCRFKDNTNFWVTRFESSSQNGGRIKRYDDSYGTNEIIEENILIDNIPVSQCHNMNLHLFCALDGKNNPFRFSEVDLYYLKIIKGNKVIRNLVPVHHKSDNAVGLYDIEHDYLYVSQGDDPFVAGPIIS